ncbi:MAG: hypothetical protein AMXMBFR17_29490 [Candidatus Jettenia caeni]|nr:MAG: hypothetical protein JETCAE04_09390 [Candidatus Jettenia caeni]
MHLRSTAVFVHPQCPEHLGKCFYQRAINSDERHVKVMKTILKGKAVRIMCEFIDEGSQELWVKDMTSVTLLK